MKRLKLKAFLIDHYDSFTYNLARYFNELDVDVDVCLYDSLDLNDFCCSDYDMVILSPGPRHPREIEPTLNFILHYYQSLPILGVCLGHQALAYAFGGAVMPAKNILHGKISTIKHTGDLLFNHIPQVLTVTRYHSLLVNKDSLPQDFQILAQANGEVMSIKHTKYPLYGLQYHPEAYLTQYGHQVLKNFIHLAKAKGFYNVEP